VLGEQEGQRLGRAAGGEEQGDRAELGGQSGGDLFPAMQEGREKIVAGRRARAFGSGATMNSLNRCGFSGVGSRPDLS